MIDREQFLRLVLEEHGEEVRDRCLDELRRNPGADPFSALDKVRVVVHDVTAPPNTGNMAFGW